LFVHELSIAQSLIEVACEAASNQGADRIKSMRARIGALSGIVKEALLFSFELAAEGTRCAGATLIIDEVPVTAMCPACGAPRELKDGYRFCCAECGTPMSEILSGRELDLVSLEIESDAAADS